MIVVATSRHHINGVFKFQKKKTALPAIQQEKIENSERDESRVDTKNLGGGRVQPYSRLNSTKCQQDQNGQASLTNTLTYPPRLQTETNYPWLSFNDLEDIYTASAQCFKYIDF